MKIGSLMTSSLAAMEGLGKNQVGPALLQVGKGLGTLVEAPRLVISRLQMPGGVARIGEFENSQLGVVIAGVDLTKLVLPIVVEVGKQIEDFEKTKVGSAIGHTASVMEEFGKNHLSSAIVTIASDLGAAAEEATYKAGEWAKKIPVKTTLIVGAIAVTVCPALVSGPLLSAVGFSSTGPVAGGLAATVQTANIAAGGIFATAQSAAMGGYGVPIVAGTIQAAAVTFGVATKVLME